MGRKIALGAGVALGIGIILYSIVDIIAIGDFVTQTGSIGITQYIAIALFGLFIFLLLGASVIRRALAYHGERLRGRGLMSTVVLASVYLIVEGVALLSYGNKIGSSTFGTTLTDNGILLIASGILVIAAGALLLQSGQSSRIAGGVISIVLAALLTDLINGQASTTASVFSFSTINLANLPWVLTAIVVQGVTGSSTLAIPGYFLAIYWTEIVALVLGGIGLLAWAVLQNRKEARYASTVGVAALMIYGIGLAWYGFQTSISIFNGLGRFSSVGLTGYSSRVLSESQLLVWSLLIVGIAGILVLIASGFGIGLVLTGVQPMMIRQQTVQVPAAATGGAFCRKCGAQARLGDSHCRSCGAPLT